MSDFYAIPENERIVLTQRAMASGTTLMSRWTALGPPEASGWSGRAAIAAARLTPFASVLDIGCGTMTLERHLPLETEYIPLDVVRRDDRTIVCDLNAEPLPAVSAQAAACLGLLEYLFDVPSLLRALRERVRACVLSYNTSDASGFTGASSTDLINARRAHAWVNEYSTLEIEAAYVSAGWQIASRERIDATQTLWKIFA